MAETAPVRSGQIYESCVPTFIKDGRNVHTRIRITEVPPSVVNALLHYGPYASGKVCVVTLEDDREIRPRELEISQLHASGTTERSKPRRTGYRLVQDVEASDG